MLSHQIKRRSNDNNNDVVLIMTKVVMVMMTTGVQVRSVIMTQRAIYRQKLWS